MTPSASDKSPIILGSLSIVIAILLPAAIFSGQSRLQDRATCTSAILDFRKELALFYALGSDLNGNVKQGDNFSLRVATQGSRDTVYTVCLNVFDRHDQRIVEPADEPWTQSPSSISYNWSYTNVNDLYEKTAAALTNISDAPLWSPWGIAIG